jgi:hypothetical protein
MISWDLVTQIDTVIDPAALGSYGVRIKETQPILHAWIGRRQEDFNRAEWVLFCRTAVIIWKSIEQEAGPIPAVRKDDLQTAWAQRSQRLSPQLGIWPEEHLASAVLSWIGDYVETDLLMFAGFKYQQALGNTVERKVRSEKGAEFLLKVWILVDAILSALDRKQLETPVEQGVEESVPDAESDSFVLSESEDGQA